MRRSDLRGRIVDPSSLGPTGGSHGRRPIEGYRHQSEHDGRRDHHRRRGGIGAATAVAILAAASRARILGVIIAAVSVIANVLWLPYYPLWAVIIIAFDIFVISALIVSWQDIKNV